MAGESASESARRQREKAERLARSADLYERGAIGEQETAAALSALPADRWTAFHDVHWPGRRYANIDHVVVGPGGVFVIDSKNWSGAITVRDDVLRQNGRSRETTVAAAAEAALAIAGITAALPPQRIQPVLCFVRDDELTGWARDVMVCSTSNLVHLLLSRPEVIDESQVRRAALELDVSLAAATEPQVSVPAPRRTPQRRTPSATPSRRNPPRRKSSRSSAKAFVMVGVGLLLVVSVQVRTVVAEGLVHVFSPDVVEKNPPPKRTPTRAPDGTAKPEPAPGKGSGGN